MPFAKGSRAVRCALRVVSFVLLFVAFVPAAPAHRRVLLLHSLEHESAPFSVFEEALRRDLGRQSSDEIDFYEVSLHNGSGDDQKPVLDYVLSRFAQQPPDLLVPIGGPAARFAEENRSKLFPTTPMLLAAVDQRHLENAVLTSNDTVVAVKHDPSQVIETILRVLPETKNIFVVLGNSELERFWRHTLELEFERFGNQLTFTWGNDLSFSELLRRCAAMPPHSAIFYALMSVDSAGIAQTEETALGELHSVANAPIFGAQSNQFGHGIVGGPLMSMDDLGETAARVTVRILDGESPGNIEPQTQLPGLPLFDWRELRRWNIDENRLPPGSVLDFREPTLWQRYKLYVVASVFVCLAELLLVFALFINLVKRRRAEKVARKLGRQLLNAEEAERARVARELHDDITQRLARLVIDTGGLDSEQNQATRGVITRGVREELVRLSEDVHSLAYKMHPALLQRLGLAKSLRAECERFSRQESISVDFKLEEISAQVPHDTALCLIRLTQEALSNVGRHAHSKTAEVSLRTAADGLELTVTDTGVGFNAGNGSQPSLGFASMQERVRLLEGKLTIKSTPNQGTMVRAWVPFEKNRVGATR
jgi:signal transduction histidine kinase/ABC-type uncharacterized transport system substrate-binding protein